MFPDESISSFECTCRLLLPNAIPSPTVSLGSLSLCSRRWSRSSFLSEVRCLVCPSEADTVAVADDKTAVGILAEGGGEKAETLREDEADVSMLEAILSARER